MIKDFGMRRSSWIIWQALPLWEVLTSREKTQTQRRRHERAEAELMAVGCVATSLGMSGCPRGWKGHSGDFGGSVAVLAP